MASSPYYPTECEEMNRQHGLFLSYREQVRAFLHHLIHVQGYEPGHPMVAAFNCHLFMTTAHAEIQKVFEHMKVMTDVRALVRACFVGCDLRYSNTNAHMPAATSLEHHYEERDSKDDYVLVMQDNGWGGRG